MLYPTFDASCMARIFSPPVPHHHASALRKLSTVIHDGSDTCVCEHPARAARAAHRSRTCPAGMAATVESDTMFSYR